LTFISAGTSFASSVAKTMTSLSRIGSCSAEIGTCSPGRLASAVTFGLI
jgi:hypothetical protein